MNARQKNLAVIGALIVVAGALGLYAYFGVMKGGEAEEAHKEAAEKLLTVEEKAADGGTAAPEITALTVTAKGDTSVLDKDKDGWRITSPVSARADTTTVDPLVNQLVNGKVKATVEEKPTDADLQKYGLAPPRFTVVAKAKVNGKDRTLTIQGGIENTFDGSVYLRKDDDPKVYSADGLTRVTLEKTTYDLREKELLAIDPAKVTKLSLHAPKGQYVLTHEGTQWKVQPAKGAAIPGDPETITQMIGSLKNERVQAFPKDSAQARKEAGLDAPSVDATFSLQSGGSVRIALSRKTVNGAEKDYALREENGGAVLAEVPSNALLDLDKSLDDLRDKTVLRFDRDAVARAVFHPATGAEIVAQKVTSADGGVSEEWEVLAPQKGPAKKWKLSSILWTLGSMRATGFGPENPSWNKFGIGPKSQWAAVYDASGQELARLTVGGEVKGKANTGYVRGTRDQVLEADTSRLVDLPKTVGDVLETPPAPAAGSDAGTAFQTAN